MPPLTPQQRIEMNEENFDVLMRGVFDAAAEHGIPRVDVRAAG